MFIWWRNDNRELTFQGDHTGAVEMRRRYGMILFIVSVIVFFLAFLWAFFHSNLSPTVEIKSFWSLKIVNFCEQWAAADYMVLATILLACATWLWLANNSEKTEKFRNSVKGIVWLFIGMSSILLVTDKNLQEQLYQDWHKFLELPDSGETDVSHGNRINCIICIPS